MATETKLRQLADKGCPVYYFYSSERYLVRQAVTAITRILTADTRRGGGALECGQSLSGKDPHGQYGHPVLQHVL